MFAPTPQSGDSKSNRFSVLVVDDHPVFRIGVSQLLAQLPNAEVCGQAASSLEALDAMRRLKPDMAIVDVSLPGTDGLGLTKAMLAEHPKLRVLVFSMHDELVYALRALCAGARGYVMKSESPESILKAVEKVSDGSIYVSPLYAEQPIFKALQSCARGVGSPLGKLSDRERDVFERVGRRQSTRQIATNLNLSVKTVETHRANLLKKLGLRNALELVRFAIAWDENLKDAW